MGRTVTPGLGQALGHAATEVLIGPIPSEGLASLAAKVFTTSGFAVVITLLHR